MDSDVECRRYTFKPRTHRSATNAESFGLTLALDKGRNNHLETTTPKTAHHGKWRTHPLAPTLRTPYLRGDGFCSLCDRLYIPEALSNSSAAGSVRTLVRLSGDHLYIQVPRNTEPSVCSGSRHLPYSISRPRHCAPFANIGPALRLD